jgi:hypothetical protein
VEKASFAWAQLVAQHTISRHTSALLFCGVPSPLQAHACPLSTDGRKSVAFICSPCARLDAIKSFRADTTFHAPSLLPDVLDRAHNLRSLSVRNIKALYSSNHCSLQTIDHSNEHGRLFYKMMSCMQGLHNISLGLCSPLYTCTFGATLELVSLIYPNPLPEFSQVICNGRGCAA